MSLSDSDEDCYGNAAKKLQCLKEKYVSEKHNDISAENISNSNCDKLSNLVAASSKLTDDSNTSFNVNNTDDEELTLEAIIASNTKPKRGRYRNVVDEAYEPFHELEPRSRRPTTRSQKTATNMAHTDKIPPVSDCSDTPNRSRRGRGRRTESNLETVIRGRGCRSSRNRSTSSNNRRGRGSRTRTRGTNLRHNPTVQENAYPVYTIGDFGDYPDMCGNQELFTTKSTSNDVEIIEDDPLENDNEELSVKVYWQSTQVLRFKIRKYQKLTPIFKYFTEKENIGISNLLLMYNDRVIKVDDTPHTIDYNIAEFIDGGIVNRDVTGLVKQINTEINTKEPKDGFKVKFQCQTLKKPFETIVKQYEKLTTAMMLCAEHLELSIEKLKFYFDGDLISGKKTPEELGLENDDCIDVNIIS